MFDFEDEDEQVDPAELARQAAEDLNSSDWKARFGACRILESVGAAAAPHAKLIARLAAKDKEADVRKAASNLIAALRASGAELPDLGDAAEEEDPEKARELKKKQREEAWAERRRQREKEWEEKEKVLKEQERREEERQRREDQLLYQQYEQYYAEEPGETPTPAAPPAAAAPSGIPTSLAPGGYPPEAAIPQRMMAGVVFGNPSEAAGSAAAPPPAAAPAAPRRSGRSRPGAFSSYTPMEPQERQILHPAFAQPQEDVTFEIEPEDDTAEREAAERAERERELREKEEQAEERRRQRAEAASRVQDIVPFGGPRANFRLLSEVLTMRLEREDMTPQEIVEVWEKRWGIPFANRVKFEVPDSERRFLRMRDDIVPLHPVVVTLHDKAGAVLAALAPAMREYGGLLPEEAEEVRLAKLKRSAETAERRQKAAARDKERIHVKEQRNRLKGGSFQERQDRRVMEMRGMVHAALGVNSDTTGPEGRPQREMRELKRSSLT